MIKCQKEIASQSGTLVKCMKSVVPVEYYSSLEKNQRY